MFNIINKLYTKDISLFNEFKPQDLFMLVRWLGQDMDNINILKRLDKFLFTIDPKHYLTLLFFGIHRKYRAPYLEYVKADKKIENQLLKRIQRYLKYSDREFDRVKPIVLREIRKDLKGYCSKLGLTTKESKKSMGDINE